MTHLIKLELKKFGIAQNIIFMFAAILFSILFITISLWDSMTDPKQVKDTFESTYLVIQMIVEHDCCCFFCILLSVDILVQIFVDHLWCPFDFAFVKWRLIKSCFELRLWLP